MSLSNEKIYTTDYIESLLEGQWTELIYGVVYDLAAFDIVVTKVYFENPELSAPALRNVC